MALTNKKFVGFGFGPIQAGLIVYEAYKSGNPASNLTPSVLYYYITRPIPATVAIGKAIFEADELAHAIPCVDFYINAIAEQCIQLTNKIFRSGKGSDN